MIEIIMKLLPLICRMKQKTKLILAIVIAISVANVSCGLFGKSNYQKHCMCPVYRSDRRR